MRLRLKPILAIALLPLMLSGCFPSLKPATAMRTYEESSTERMNDAIAKAFGELGYSTVEAKLEKKVTTTESKADTSKSVTYEYGPAQLVGSGRSCMKIASTSTRYDAPRGIQLVTLKAANITCYTSIGKMNVAIDTDKATYERFFAALSRALGKEGRMLGAP